jgi:hypothetical protein
LYLVDRERYQDGKLGDPYLIFPTLGMNHGDNRVSPGKMIEIPPQGEKVPVMWLRRNGDSHVGEEILVVVTKRPLNVSLGEREIKISPDLIAEWERNVPDRPERLDRISGGPQAWTAAEKQAGSSQERLLTQDDPLPDHIFRVPMRVESLILRLPLTIR